jgi:hypothetical protein
MLHKCLGLVLGQDNDLIDPRINTVGKGKINKKIDTPEGNRGFGPVSGERHQPFTFASGHNEGQTVLHIFKSPCFHGKDPWIFINVAVESLNRIVSHLFQVYEKADIRKGYGFLIPLMWMRVYDNDIVLSIQKPGRRLIMI